MLTIQYNITTYSQFFAMLKSLFSSSDVYVENSEVGEHFVDRGRRHGCIWPCANPKTRQKNSSRRGTQQVKLIDFGMATVNRICKKEAHICLSYKKVTLSYLRLIYFLYLFISFSSLTCSVSFLYHPCHILSSLHVHLVSSSVFIDVYRIAVFHVFHVFPCISVYLVAFISENLMCTVQVRGKQSYQVRGKVQ